MYGRVFMIDLGQGLLITGGSMVGGFVGTTMYWWVWCPNHRCCQTERLKKCLEGGDKCD